MNRKVILLTLAALLLPFVAQAHPLPTGAAGALHWLAATDHVATLAVAVAGLLAGLGWCAVRR